MSGSEMSEVGKCLVVICLVGKCQVGKRPGTIPYQIRSVLCLDFHMMVTIASISALILSVDIALFANLDSNI